MVKYKIGVIRVTTPADMDLPELHGKLLEGYFPQFKTVSGCIEDQPEGVYDEETEMRAAPKVVRLAGEMARNADALIVSCARDSGVDILKKELSIPVIGAGESAGFLASRFGDYAAALGLSESVPEGYKKYLGDDVPAYIPDGVSGARDLAAAAGYESTVRKALEITATGVDVIAITSTDMAETKISRVLEEKCGIPVIDPILAAGLMAYFELSRKN